MNIFKTRDGQIVFGQRPNLPIIVWFVTFVVLRLPLTLNTQFEQVISLVSFGALFTWAWLELFDGVNLYRRILGGVVLVVIIGFRIV